MFLRLTYQDLADRLGITKNAARVLAQRNGWTRIIGNDGTAQVAVPEAELAAHQAKRTSAPHEPPAQAHAPHETVHPLVPPAVLARLQAENDELRAALAHERDQRDADRDARTRLADALSDLLARVGQDEAARREEVVRLIEINERLSGELEAAHDALRIQQEATAAERRSVQGMFDQLREFSDQIAAHHEARADLARMLDALRRDRQAEADAHAKLMAERDALATEVGRLRVPWWRRIARR